MTWFKTKTLSACLALITWTFFSNLANASLLGTYHEIENKSKQSIRDVTDLLRLQDNSRSVQKQMVNDLVQQSRLQTMQDFAYGIALRASLNTHIGEISGIIKANERNLDAIYNFEPLMLAGGRVIPPIIVEARDIYNQSNDHQIRLSGAVYDIHEQAMFSSVAPNWRQYLYFASDDINNAYRDNSVANIDYASVGFQPKTDQEKKAWVEATKRGWNDGIEQANNLLKSSFDNLNRDYTGMVRYHTFVAQGRINMPIVNRYELYDTNSGQRLVLDEQLLQIVVLPEFSKSKMPKESYTGINYMATTPVKPKLVEQTVSNVYANDLEDFVQPHKKDNEPIHRRVLKDEKPLDVPFEQRTPQLLKPSDVSPLNHLNEVQPLQLELYHEYEPTEQLVIPHRNKPPVQGVNQNMMSDASLATEPTNLMNVRTTLATAQDVGVTVTPLQNTSNGEVTRLTNLDNNHISSNVANDVANDKVVNKKSSKKRSNIEFSDGRPNTNTRSTPARNVGIDDNYEPLIAEAVADEPYIEQVPTSSQPKTYQSTETKKFGNLTTNTTTTYTIKSNEYEGGYVIEKKDNNNAR